jgi:hypothetical protein
MSVVEGYMLFRFYIEKNFKINMQILIRSIFYNIYQFFQDELSFMFLIMKFNSEYILEELKIDPVEKKLAQCKLNMVKSYQQNGRY